MIEIDFKKGLALCNGVSYESFTLNIDAGCGELFSYSMIKNKGGKFLGGNGDLFGYEEVCFFVDWVGVFIENGEADIDTSEFPFVFDSDAWAEVVGAYYEGDFEPDKKKLDEIISGISKKYIIKGGKK